MKTYNLENKKIKEIGNIINRKRKNKNISISELACKLQVNAGYITKLEKGTNTKSINVLLLKSICEELDLNYFELLKKIDYLNNDIFILSIEDITKLKRISKNLAHKLGEEDDTLIEFLDFFIPKFKESFKTNIRTFENITEFNPSENTTEFMINSFNFKNQELKALFKKETKIKNGKYILVNINNQYLIKRFYLEKNEQVILESPLKEEGPILMDFNSLKYYGTLYQTIKQEFH